jgi:MoaA/NifB/PqqE/SkfB family radical SAM enzyme
MSPADPAQPSFDPLGPLFTPRARIEQAGDVFVRIDPDRVAWISTNAPGHRLLEQADGRSGAELLAELPEGERLHRSTQRFFKQAAKRGFLFNEPVPSPLYQGRREFLEPERLHEFWVLTNDDCNLRCKHCYTIDRVLAGDPGLPGDSLKAIVDEARELGAEVFYFTGGEPFRRADIVDLIGHVASRSKLIVFTNGTLLTEEIAQQLQCYRDRLIFQISIDGDGEEFSARVRGKTAFDRALRGLERLLHYGLRVGVSSTPTGACWQSIPDLTERLATLEVDERRVEYHHLILLLDQGGALQHASQMAITYEQFAWVLQECRDRIQRVKRRDRRCRLVLANDKIFKALASHGPKKDLCGAGYTILGMTADGELHPCAATINDSRHHCGRLVEEDGSYRPGRLTHLYWNSEHIERIRRFSLARQAGESEADLRYFHGGGCWYNMEDTEAPFSSAHPFAEVYEQFTLKEIVKAATRGVEEISTSKPELYHAMHRQRIACAGERKTVARGEQAVDNGYCICFA